MSDISREDFDYVSFANYKKDTDEITNRSVAMGEDYRRQIRDRERVIWAMVKASGGKISVYEPDMAELPRGELVISTNPADNTREFSIRPTTGRAE